MTTHTHIHLQRNRNNNLAALSAVASVEIGWDDVEGCWRILLDSDDGAVVLLAPSLDIDLEMQQPPLRLIDGEGRT